MEEGAVFAAPGSVNFGQIVKQLARGQPAAADLSEEDAHALFAAMLDGGVPDLELGAVLTALRVKGESPVELLGFHRAVTQRLYPLQAPASRVRPLAIPAYGGARSEHNLLPLLGLLLRRLGVPVLFHGTLEGSGRVACVYILRELGIMPSATLAQAQKALDEELLTYVPIAALCPGLASLLALRHRLGVRNTAHTLVKLIDPFEGQGVRMASASVNEQLERLAAFFAAAGLPGLLLRSTEGEPFADPRRRPKIEWFDQGERCVLFDEEAGPVKPVAGLPAEHRCAFHRHLDAPGARRRSAHPASACQPTRILSLRLRIHRRYEPSKSDCRGGDRESRARWAPPPAAPPLCSRRTALMQTR